MKRIQQAVTQIDGDNNSYPPNEATLSNAIKRLNDEGKRVLNLSRDRGTIYVLWEKET